MSAESKKMRECYWNKIVLLIVKREWQGEKGVLTDTKAKTDKQKDNSKSNKWPISENYGITDLIPKVSVFDIPSLRMWDKSVM